jgi:hypothetical protein
VGFDADQLADLNGALNFVVLRLNRESDQYDLNRMLFEESFELVERAEEKVLFLVIAVVLVVDAAEDLEGRIVVLQALP